MLHFAPGHNMSTTADAYTVTGGFPRTKIEDESEDVTYNIRIATEFGLGQMGWDNDMVVYTSQRRLRAMGYLGALRYYVCDSPDRRRRLTDDNPNFR